MTVKTTLNGRTLIIEKAELCCPFISGRQEFGIMVWNDSVLIACPQTRLPMLHQKTPYHGNFIIEMKKCNAVKTIDAETVGIISFSNDSISPINYIIDIQRNGIVYMQTFTKKRFSDEMRPNSLLKKRKLSFSEMSTFNELMKFHEVDTIYDPFCRNGCRFGRFFVDHGFRFKGKDYPFDHYNQRNSNMAIQGFLFTTATKGTWKSVKGRRTFCAELKHYWDKEAPVENLRFSVK